MTRATAGLVHCDLPLCRCFRAPSDPKYAKLFAPKVASKASDGLDDAASFRVEPGPVPLGIEGSAVDVNEGPH